MNRPFKRRYTAGGAEAAPSPPSQRCLYDELLAMSPPTEVHGDWNVVDDQAASDEEQLKSEVPPQGSAGAREGFAIEGTCLSEAPPNLDARTALDCFPPSAAAPPYIPPRRFGSANSARQRRIPIDVQEVMCRETIRYEGSHEFTNLRRSFLQGYFAILDLQEVQAEEEAQRAAEAHEKRVAASVVHLAVGSDVLEQLAGTMLGGAKLIEKPTASPTCMDGPVVDAPSEKPPTDAESTPVFSCVSPPKPVHPSRWSGAADFSQPAIGDNRVDSQSMISCHGLGSSEPTGGTAEEVHADFLFASVPRDFAMECLSAVPTVSIHELEKQRSDFVESSLKPSFENDVEEVVFVRGRSQHRRKKLRKKVLANPPQSMAVTENPHVADGSRKAAERPPLAPDFSQRSLATSSVLESLHQRSELLTPAESLAQQESVLVFRLAELEASEQRRVSAVDELRKTKEALRSVPFQRPDSAASRTDVHDKVVRCMHAFEQLERRGLCNAEERAWDAIIHSAEIEASLVLRATKSTNASPNADPPANVSSTNHLRTSPDGVVGEIYASIRSSLSPEDPDTELLLRRLEQCLAVEKEEETQRSLHLKREQIAFHKFFTIPAENLRQRWVLEARERRLVAASGKLALSCDGDRRPPTIDRYAVAAHELQSVLSLHSLETQESDARSALSEAEARDAERMELAHWSAFNLRGEYNWGHGLFSSTRPRWSSRCAARAGTIEEYTSSRQTPPAPPQRSSSSARPLSTQRSYGPSASFGRPLATNSKLQSSFGLHPLPLRPETPSNGLLLPQLFQTPSPVPYSSRYGSAMQLPLQAAPSPLRDASGGLLRVVKLEIQCREELEQQYFRQMPIHTSRGTSMPSLSSPECRVQLPNAPNRPSAAAPSSATPVGRESSALLRTASHYLPTAPLVASRTMVVPGGGLTSTGGYRLASYSPSPAHARLPV